MAQFNMTQFIPVVLEEDENWIITAGYNQPCHNDIKARNGFYVVSGRKPNGVDYIHPNLHSHDMTVDEVRKLYPEATLGDFFPEEIQDWIMRSYQFGVNPLPALRIKFPEFFFKFVENLTNTPDVPLPEEGAVILVNRQGYMAVYEEVNISTEPDDDPVGEPSLAIP